MATLVCRNLSKIKIISLPILALTPWQEWLFYQIPFTGKFVINPYDLVDHSLLEIIPQFLTFFDFLKVDFKGKALDADYSLISLSSYRRFTASDIRQPYRRDFSRNNDPNLLSEEYSTVNEPR
ncbi:hypothetical protein LOAG_02326 [Loa loa]|uniref:Uncharacterized protein n=1 Tax=Loa loa TaxID=7209 RepID=A0A1S0U797_LOALO|nr:hypothetical protein LOAG_02326 [Loa loa]EFO26153.1 hypothetical protein LOAG_02326 [Loa loa]